MCLAQGPQSIDTGTRPCLKKLNYRFEYLCLDNVKMYKYAKFN